MINDRNPHPTPPPPRSPRFSSGRRLVKRRRRLLPALAFAACVTVLLSVAAGAATPRELADEYCRHTNAAWCVDKDGDGTRESAPQLHPRFTEEGIEHLREHGRYYDPYDVGPEPEPDPTPTPTPVPTAAPLPPTSESATGLLSEDKTKRTRDKATLLMSRNWNNHWYYRADRAPDDSCSNVEQAGTIEKDLTGLSAGRRFTYTAYSNAECTNSIGSVTFTTALVAGNTTLGSGSTVSRRANADRQLANSFTTGPHAAGYDLRQIIIRFLRHDNDPDPIRVAIHAASGNAPGARLTQGILNNVDGDPKHTTTGDSMRFHFRCDYASYAGCPLASETTYYVVVSIPNSSKASGNAYNWHRTNANGETRDPSDNGFTLGDAMLEKNGGGSWQPTSGNHAGRFDVVAFPR